jgi:medium-chain acyl-[acyl-carrier-protein] hydrolase
MEPVRQATRVAFEVHSFDADAFGLLAPAALAGYLQEAAGRSADGLGFGLADLKRRGDTWVLARERFELDRPVRLGETIEVETWPSGLERLWALRDFVLRCGGQEIGRAVTTWLVLDLASRRPLRPERLLPEPLRQPQAHVLPPAAPPPPELPAAGLELRLQVRFADIDVNEHVTNASYVAWALEAVDEVQWREQRLASLDIQFLAECRRGATVLSRSSAAGDGSRLHAIVREEDGAVLARARTGWVPR